MAFLPPKVITDKINAYDTLNAKEKEDFHCLCDHFMRGTPSRDDSWFSFLSGFGFGLFF